MRFRLLTSLLLASLAVTSAGCATSTDDVAQSSDDITVHHGNGIFESGVLTSRLMWTADPESFGRQRSQNWCWAATLQTLILFNGLPITQEQIVMRAFGGLIDRPAASAEAIAASVDGWVFSDGVRFATVRAVGDSNPPDGLRIRSELENDRPGILALKNPDGNGGHAFVITSITYQLVPNAFGGTTFVPLSVKLRDPWPDNPSFSVLSWQEVQQRFLGLVYLGVER